MDGDDGDLWVGTRDRGVLHVSGGAVQEFGADEGLPAPHVLSIAAREDRAFVGTAFGVAEFRNGRFIRPLAEGVLALSMLAPTRGNLLIGTIDEGVVEVALESPRGPGFGPLASPGPTEPRRLLEIDGTAYALTSEAFFERDDATGLWREQIAARPVWADRNVSAMAFDRFGRLWIGYFDRGLDIGNAVGDAVEGVGGGGIRTALHIEDDQVFCVNRIVADPYRDVQVVATANGLILIGLDGTVLRRLGRDDGLISEHVTDIAIHADGLVAATAAGVTRMDPAGPESIYAFHGLVNNHVYALAMDEGGLMAGTLGGLSWIEDGFVRASYTTSNSPLSHNWISAIVGLDVSGTSSPSGSRFFVGTYGGGVMRLDGNGVWTGFPDIPEGTVVNPNAMLAVDGRVFAGTLESGLLVYDPDSERWRAETSGLPSLNVTALAASADRLFVGTDNGAISMPLPGVNR
jgi:ligand-binding sensor domain-containing protein